MDLPIISVTSTDIVAILGSIFLVSILVLPSIRRRGALEDREWTRLRAAVWAPFVVLLLACFREDQGFAPIRLIYHIGATVFPVIGVYFLLVLKRRTTTRASAAALGVFATVCVLLFPLAVWMTFVEPRWLDVTETVVETDENAAEEVRVVVLADIQTDRFGGWESRIVRETNALKPDIIVVPGDILQLNSDDYASRLAEAVQTLDELDAEKIYIVEGDVDRDIKEFLGGNRTVLKNQIVRTTVKNRSIAVAGLTVDFNSVGARETMERLEADPSDLKLVVAHRPMAAMVAQAEESSIDLVIVGHTHGGQISIPFVGPLVTMTDAPRDVAAGGLNRLGGRQIYVSRGLGLERKSAPRLRLNCRPELALLKIR